jgi:hypothetical protein
MPTLSELPVSSKHRILIAGESGAGKTSLVATLANAGYKIRIADFDGGLNILENYVEPEARGNVHYINFQDELGKSDAIDRFFKALRKWDDLGAVADWDDDTVLVIDSLAFMGEASLRKALGFAGKKVTDRLSPAEWYDAQREVKQLLQYLLSDSVKCHVVVLTHIKYVEDDSGISTGYPSAVSKGFDVEVPKYFNDMYRLDVKQSKGEYKRTLRTQADNRMKLKCSAPKFIDDNEEADLAVIFDKLKKNIAQQDTGVDKSEAA